VLERAGVRTRVFLAALLLGGCIFNDGGTEIPNGIRGQLVDPQGNPVPGATLQLYAVDYVPSLSTGKQWAGKRMAGTAVTDANGDYVLSVPYAGVFNIEGRKDGAGVFIDSVAVSGKGVDVPRDTLKPLGFVRGVSYMPTENSLNQVRVTLYIPGTRQITKPSPGGAFNFPGLPEGRYQIVFDPTLDAYDVKILEVEVRAGDTLDLDTVRLQIHRSDTVRVNSGPVSGTWGPGKTYILQGASYIPEGSTLNILPGTQIVLAEYRTFLVEGGLFALGTPESLITFRAGNGAGWQGLDLGTRAFGTISRTVIEGAATYGISLASTKMKIRNSVFRYSEVGLYIAVGAADSVLLVNNVFHDIEDRAVVVYRGRSDFRNNIFLRNLIAFNRYYCQTSSPPAVLSETTVHSSLFYQNGRDFTVQNCQSPGYGNDFFLFPTDSVNADPQFNSLVKGNEDYHLKPGSAARGSGVNGTDMGIYSAYAPE
jgi:hypothetical protein